MRRHLDIPAALRASHATYFGDVRRGFWRRFDLMTEVLGLDRRRAAGWTLARVLQNLIWEAENGGVSWHADPDRAVAALLLGHRPRPSA